MPPWLRSVATTSCRREGSWRGCCFDNGLLICSTGISSNAPSSAVILSCCAVVSLISSASADASLVVPASCGGAGVSLRSEEHTSELQSHLNLVCRLLLEKKKYRMESPGPR